MGDFYMIRQIEDRNKPGENMKNILLFNETISALGMVEIPLKGK